MRAVAIATRHARKHGCVEKQKLPHQSRLGCEQDATNLLYVGGLERLQQSVGRRGDLGAHRPRQAPGPPRVWQEHPSRLTRRTQKVPTIITTVAPDTTKKRTERTKREFWAADNDRSTRGLRHHFKLDYLAGGQCNGRPVHRENA